ncbi:MAG: choice-of-anchor N protein, partial [Planctomycetota bacterium]
FYSIGDFSLKDSPVADLQYTFPTYPGSAWTGNAGQLNAYEVTVSGYSVVHFDAYDTVASGSKVKFAPFSHDASVVVPEPTTLLLLGAGLAGIGLVRRRKRPA